MLLDGKNAVIYGGGGSIGGAVARTFAREGARVFLAGRTESTLEKVAADIRAAGGRADTDVVDVYDEPAVTSHLDAVVARAGSVDVLLSAVNDNDVQGVPFVDMTLDDYLAPVASMVRSKFITSRAAARHMIRQGAGVILFVGGPGPRQPEPVIYHYGGLVTGFEAVEAMRRQLAAELGEHGVRVVSLHTGGLVDSLPDFPGADEIVATIAEKTALGRAAVLADAAEVAAFVASDRARSMTGATANITCGAYLD